MRSKNITVWIGLLLLGVILAACAGASPAAQPAVPSPSATEDLCAPNTIVTQVKKVHDLIRQFDDGLFVANLTPQAQLSNIVMQLQGVRRQAENLEVPGCVSTLQSTAVQYMNSVIVYLAHFMGGGTADRIGSEIQASQSLRIAYETEMARLIGATYVPPPTQAPLPTQVPATPVPDSGTPAAAVTVSNTSQATVNLRDAPTQDGQLLGYLQPGESAKAIGRTEASDWIAIELAGAPNGFAWVYAELVTVAGAVDTLPTPQPAPTPAP